MSDAKIAGRQPIITTLTPGTYAWCACGRSQDQPFCDGSHEGTGLEPHEWTVEAAKKVALCACKRTATPPLCDGSHKRLPPP